MEPAGQETGRGGLRLGEDGGRRPEATLLRRGSQPVLDGVGHRQLQPGEIGQTDADDGVNRGIPLSLKTAHDPQRTTNRSPTSIYPLNAPTNSRLATV